MRAQIINSKCQLHFFHASCRTIQYTSSLLHCNFSFSPETTSCLIDATSSTRLFNSQFVQQSRRLSVWLCSRFPSLSSQKVGLTISPPSLHVPVLYFSLISMNVII